MKGLDLSSYQKGINFDEIKNQGYEFLILRGGFTGWGTGTNYNKDNSFEEFYQIAKQKGFKVGCYYYSCANTYEKGVAEAKYLYENCLKGKQFEYPIYIDVEDTHHQIQSKVGTTQAIIGFCETLENLGFYVGLYANLNWIKNYIDYSSIKQYTLWLAQWTNVPTTEFNYHLWQNSNSGFIHTYRVDTNISYIDFEKIIKEKKLNGFNDYQLTIDDIIDPLQNFTDDELAKKVIEGLFGNGTERKEKLGNRYTNVQNIVNNLMNNDLSNFTDEELAQKVIRGEFGNGTERKEKLGNRYTNVQNIVNNLMK